MKVRKWFVWSVLVLAHVPCVILLGTTLSMMTVQYMIAPRYEWDKEKEEVNLVAPARWCPPSTEDLEDLVVTDEMSRSEVKDRFQLHGSAILRDVIEDSILKDLRGWVLEENVRSKGRHYVHEGEHRAKINLSHREAGPLMNRFASNPVIRGIVEDTLGPNASFVSMDVVTNYHGAKKQAWHRDSEPSKLNYPSRFVDQLSFTIPMQDTTERMGATAICPGTHLCNAPRLEEYAEDETDDDHVTDDDLLPRTPKQISPRGFSPVTEPYRQSWNSSALLQQRHSSYREWMRKELPFCKLRARLNAGDVFFYDTDMYHRGEAHTDPDADHRVLLFLTFAESRTDPQDRRFYPFGVQYIMAWDSYGHTIDEFLYTQDWRPWHSALGNMGDYLAYYTNRAYRACLPSSWWGTDPPTPTPTPTTPTPRRIPWTIYDFCANIWTDPSEYNDILVEGDWLTANYVRAKTLRFVDLSKKVTAAYAQLLAFALLANGALPKPFTLVLFGGSVCAASSLFWRPTRDGFDDDDVDVEIDDGEVYDEMRSRGDGLPTFYLVAMVWPAGFFPLMRFVKKLSRQQKVKVV